MKQAFCIIDTFSPITLMHVEMILSLNYHFPGNDIFLILKHEENSLFNPESIRNAFKSTCFTDDFNNIYFVKESPDGSMQYVGDAPVDMSSYDSTVFCIRGDDLDSYLFDYLDICKMFGDVGIVVFLPDEEQIAENNKIKYDIEFNDLSDDVIKCIHMSKNYDYTSEYAMDLIRKKDFSSLIRVLPSQIYSCVVNVLSLYNDVPYDSNLVRNQKEILDSLCKSNISTIKNEYTTGKYDYVLINLSDPYASSLIVICMSVLGHSHILGLIATDDASDYSNCMKILKYFKLNTIKFEVRPSYISKSLFKDESDMYKELVNSMKSSIENDVSRVCNAMILKSTQSNHENDDSSNVVLVYMNSDINDKILNDYGISID